MAYASSASLVKTSCSLDGADASCQSALPHGLPMLRSNPFLRCVAACVLTTQAWVSCAGADETSLQFESDIRPILKEHCWHCHGEEEKVEGQLDLRLVRFMQKGGETGPAVVPGDAAASLIIQRIESGEMPPGEKKLSADQLAKLKTWVTQGAQTARPEPEKLDRGLQWTDEERNFWAFVPVKRPGVPVVAHQELVRTPIDAFVLKSLEERQLGFSPEANRRTLIRRLSFDLLGLPPTPEEVDAFENDPSPSAYEDLVERLLARTQYGERWSRHWLDPVGYADSDGYTEEDPVREWTWRYRDYVIRSLNEDKPFDQFITEQLAGDELLTPPYEKLTPEQADLLVATGFLRMAPDGTGASVADPNVARNDVVADTLKIVSSSLLGLTVGCAQCHNHRYDPISQVDYHRLRAVFDPALDTKNWRAPAARLVNLWHPEDHAQADKANQEIAEVNGQRTVALNVIVESIFEREVEKLDPELQGAARLARNTPADKRDEFQQTLLKDNPSLNVDGGSAILYEPGKIGEHNKKFDDMLAAAVAKRPPQNMVACLTEVVGQIPTSNVLFRGDVNQPREAVEPGDLSVLGDRVAAIPAKDPNRPTSGRRLAFAKSLTSGTHPLVGRVLVNRVWMHHFGRGIVSSVGDFGILGAKPTHPELLDWLADEFVRGGWSLKHLHRLIVNSTVYRQSSQRTPALDQVDPENKWLARMSLRRLEAEVIRDSVLDVSGCLSDQVGGAPVSVLPDEVGQIVVATGTRDGNGILIGKSDGLGASLNRRSIYVQVRRSMPLGIMEPFDVASTSPNCDVRNQSTATPQSLLLMNSDLVLKESDRMATRIVGEVGADLQAQIRRGWQLAFGEKPDEQTASAAVRLISELTAFYEARLAAAEKKEGITPPPQQALAIWCQSLLCANRFLYVE